MYLWRMSSQLIFSYICGKARKTAQIRRTVSRLFDEMSSTFFIWDISGCGKRRTCTGSLKTLIYMNMSLVPDSFGIKKTSLLLKKSLNIHSYNTTPYWES